MQKDIIKLPMTKIQEMIWLDAELKLAIYENMKTFGGSFVKSLAECLIRADRSNLHRLVEAFSDYIIAYRPEAWPETRG